VPDANFLKETPGGTLLSVKLQPRASRSEIDGPSGDELKIRITAPPVDSAANEGLIRLLAEKLDCARSQVELVRGHKSRHKIIKLHGIPAGVVRQKLLA